MLLGNVILKIVARFLMLVFFCSAFLHLIFWSVLFPLLWFSFHHSSILCCPLLLYRLVRLVPSLSLFSHLVPVMSAFQSCFAHLSSSLLSFLHFSYLCPLTLSLFPDPSFTTWHPIFLIPLPYLPSPLNLSLSLSVSLPFSASTSFRQPPRSPSGRGRLLVAPPRLVA